MDSIFTKIINGQIPAHRVYEDKHILGFLDIHPIRPGHTLLVTKKQIDQFTDLTDKEFDQLMSAAHRFAKHMKQTFGCPRVVLRIEGFDVPHVHVHLIPVHHENDSFRANRFQEEPDHEALRNVAQQLRLEA